MPRARPPPSHHFVSEDPRVALEQPWWRTGPLQSSDVEFMMTVIATCGSKPSNIPCFGFSCRFTLHCRQDSCVRAPFISCPFFSFHVRSWFLWASFHFLSFSVHFLFIVLSLSFILNMMEKRCKVIRTSQVPAPGTLRHWHTMLLLLEDEGKP